MNARGGTRLKPTHRNPKCLQTYGKLRTREHIIGTRRIIQLPNMYLSVKIRTRSDYCRLTRINRAELSPHGNNFPVLNVNRRYLGLFNKQIRCVLQCLLHIRVIFNAITLNPQTVNSGALSPVQYARLYKRSVRRPAHLAAKRVNLTDDLPFSRATYTRIARHISNTVKRQRKYSGFQSKPSRRQSSLTPRVTCADNANIIFFKCIFH